MNKKITKTKYSNLIQDISGLLEDSRKKVYYQVNNILVQTYWYIGKHIVEFDQGKDERAQYGAGLLKKISKDLTKQYGKGFNERSLRNYRQFYKIFPKWSTVSTKLTWSHYKLIMKKEEKLARMFYIKETENENWSVRELDRQINSLLFERLALSKNKKQVLELAQKGQIIEKPKDLIRDPYVLEFLGLKEDTSYTESELEQRIIENLKQFILELGKGFMFVDRQKRINMDDERFYIDLVFYNRILRCFVLIELKIGKLTHGDLGQLQMYVNYYDRDIKEENENPTIGILLCAEKSKAVVKYTLPEDNKQISAAEYKLYLPDKKILEKEIKKLL